MSTDLARPLLVAGPVFLAGLVLPIWWLASGSPSSPLGIDAFPSAYLGDTLLIPTGCLLLVRGIRGLPRARAESRLAAALAVIAVLAAVFVQATWLRDPAPQSNWTLPAPGRFTAAGWWHAAYFVGTSLVLTVLVTVLLTRVRQARRTAPTLVAALSSGPWSAVMLIAFGSYGALAVHDSLPRQLTSAPASSLTLAGVAIAVTATLVGVAYGRLAHVLVRPVSVAVAGTAAVTVLATTAVDVEAFLSIPGLAVVCMVTTVIIECHLVRTATNTLRPTMGWGIIGTLCTAGIFAASWTLLYQALAHQATGEVAVVAMLAVVLLVGVVLGFVGHHAILPVVGACVLAISVAAVAVWFEHARAVDPTGSKVIGILIGLAMSAVTLMLKARTDNELGVPSDVTTVSPRLTGSRVVRANVVLSYFVLFGLGSFLATFAFVLATSRDLPIPAGGAQRAQDGHLLLAGLLALVPAAVLFVVDRIAKHNDRVRVVTAVPRIAVASTLGVLLISDTVWHQVTVIVVGIAALTFGWTFNSLINNVWLLQGRLLSTVDVACAGAIALLTGTATLWTLSTAINGGHATRDPWQAATVAVVALIIAGMLVILLSGAGRILGAHHTELSAWRGVAQDAASCTAIVLILIFPVLYQWSVVGFWAGFASALPLVVLFTPPFLWAMKANREHLQVETIRLITPRAEADELLAMLRQGSWWQRLIEDQRVLVGTKHTPVSPESAEFIRVLAAHTRNQNRIATSMLLLVVTSALPLLFNVVKDNGALFDALTRFARPESNT